MKDLFEERIPPKTRRMENTSCLHVRRDIERYAREAERQMLHFLNDNCHIQTVVEAMSGRGVWTEYLLKLNGLQTLTLNDMAPDCYALLVERFQNIPAVTRITNCDFFSQALEERVDLVVIDFNTFTWNAYTRNQKRQVLRFADWLEHNRARFRYLIYTDSFSYSLKFKKDYWTLEDPTTHAAYQAYMDKAIAAMGMTLMYQVVTKNRDCALTLWEHPA